ncbi:MAG: hypothetical protein FJZ58_06015 [Chlamydiae bacterium]|nr:hypothetical protein [Chlamydiota bacterium]
MISHEFIFTPGVWLGEGTIFLSMVKESLAFFTRWRVLPKDDQGQVVCLQEIQVKGLSDVMVNRFVFLDIVPTAFHIVMDNHAIGRVNGLGIIRSEMIGWEFREQEMGFEGFEFYEKQSDDLYHMHGEFATLDDLRTQVHGKIWHQKEGKVDA